MFDMLYVEKKEEVAEFLLSKVQDEMRKIRNLGNIRDNNPNGGMYNTPTLCFMETINRRGLEDCTPDRIQPKEDLLKELTEELNNLKIDCDLAAAYLENIDKEYQSLRNNIKNLNEVVDEKEQSVKGKSNSKETKKKELDELEKNTRIRFRKEKEDLKLVITTLFPDNSDIQDIIAQAISVFYEEGPDKYLDVAATSASMKAVETLLKTGIFEKHPHDSKKIRIVDPL